MYMYSISFPNYYSTNWVHCITDVNRKIAITIQTCSFWLVSDHMTVQLFFCFLTNLDHHFQCNKTHLHCPTKSKGTILFITLREESIHKLKRSLDSEIVWWLPCHLRSLRRVRWSRPPPRLCRGFQQHGVGVHPPHWPRIRKS